MYLLGQREGQRDRTGSMGNGNFSVTPDEVSSFSWDVENQGRLTKTTEISIKDNLKTNKEEKGGMLLINCWCFTVLYNFMKHACDNI